MPGYLTKTESVSFPDCADLDIRSLLDRQQYSDPQGLALALASRRPPGPCLDCCGLRARCWPNA